MCPRVPSASTQTFSTEKQVFYLNQWKRNVEVLKSAVKTLNIKTPCHTQKLMSSAHSSVTLNISKKRTSHLTESDIFQSFSQKEIIMVKSDLPWWWLLKAQMKGQRKAWWIISKSDSRLYSSKIHPQTSWAGCSQPRKKSRQFHK